MDPVSTLAIGLNLHMVPAAEGGRQSPILNGEGPGSRFGYKPNWGLPGWDDGQQTAAPVLGFSRPSVYPGDDVRAIIVPLFIANVPEWRDVQLGQVLRMYEGSRICGLGTMMSIQSVIWPMPLGDQERIAGWLVG